LAGWWRFKLSRSLNVSCHCVTCLTVSPYVPLVLAQIVQDQVQRVATRFSGRSIVLTIDSVESRATGSWPDCPINAWRHGVGRVFHQRIFTLPSITSA